MGFVMSLQTLGSFLLYFAVALAAMAIFVVLYMAVTSHHEASLIRQGNAAAAISFSGALLGFTLPLASAIIHSVSLIDMMVWSAIAIAVQLGVFLLVDRILREISKHIEEGNVAAGTTLAAASLAIGIVNAACMTY
jgi:putative membrane protein